MEEQSYSSRGPFMELQSDLKAFLLDKVTKEDFMEFTNTAFGCGDGNLGIVDINVDVENVNEKQGNETIGGFVKFEGNEFADKCCNGHELKNCFSRKRTRDCYSDMLSWIREVAKDPCDCTTGPLPERHKWKSYGVDMPWKQVLLARESMLLKKNVNASSQQSVWQRNQKMHPAMYEDDQAKSEQQKRCSQRLAKDSSQRHQDRLFQESYSSDFPSDEDGTDKLFDSTADSANFCGNQRRQKRVPVGPNSQAELPDFVGEEYISDSKWLGTKIWPLEKGERRGSLLLERDPIGKGRREMCGCHFPGSLECVKFHIREKRVRLKLELGSAYSEWKFDNMGELIALCWTKEDASKFQEIVDSNRCLAPEKYFWDELFKYFPKKGREALVSYYFNVFLLRRRGCQNRSGTNNIYSDDEDSEFGPIGNRFGQISAESPSSIFRSPKKPHSNAS